MNRIKHLLYFYNDCPNWARTSDLLINNQAFYQLNYRTITMWVGYLFHHQLHLISLFINFIVKLWCGSIPHMTTGCEHVITLMGPSSNFGSPISGEFLFLGLIVDFHFDVNGLELAIPLSAVRYCCLLTITIFMSPRNKALLLRFTCSIYHKHCVLQLYLSELVFIPEHLTYWSYPQV